MRRVRNFQQQRMTSMIRNSGFLLLVLVVSACTRMPAEYRESSRAPAVVPADNNKLETIAFAVIGSPTIYTDRITGLSTEITVESEYFSANGRLCRRYTERQAAVASSQLRLACNSGAGWVEIPVETFAG